MEQIANAPWEWREVPIWRYEQHARQLEQRALTLPHAAPSEAPGRDAAAGGGWTERSAPDS